jgi:hypothetical protein
MGRGMREADTLAPRKKKTKRRTRWKSAINVVNLAETAMLAGVGTKWVFGTDLMTFINPTTANRAQWDNSWEVTGKELLDIALGGGGGINPKSYPDGLQGVIKHNLRVHAADSIFKMVTIPIAFRLGKKLTTKPRAALNKGIRQIGLGNMVKV